MSGMGTEIFILTIEDADDGNFNVYAEGAKQEAIRVSFITDANFEELLSRLHDRGVFGFVEFSAQENACASVGEHLFNTFVRPVLKRYRDYRQRNKSEPRIALQLPPSLYYLPWEVIRDPDKQLGQFLSMEGSVIRYDLQSRPDSTLFADAPESSTYLFLLANIQERPLGPFEPIDAEFMKFLKVEPATYSNFGARLKTTKPFGLVFFGHGNVKNSEGYLVFVREERDKLWKKFTSDPKAGYTVGRDIGTVKSMRIAYIFACESAWVSKTTVFEKSITGSILQRTGLAYVVGAQTPIDSFAAQEFFRSTLVGIADGYPLDLAMSEGRKNVQAMNTDDPMAGLSYRDWWVPVLYARTTDFDILPKRKAIPVGANPPTDASSGSGGYFRTLTRSTERLFSSDNESTRDIL